MKKKLVQVNVLSAGLAECAEKLSTVEPTSPDYASTLDQIRRITQELTELSNQENK